MIFKNIVPYFYFPIPLDCNLFFRMVKYLMKRPYGHNGVPLGIPCETNSFMLEIFYKLEVML